VTETAVLPERQYALSKIATGDWLCWSNDRTQVWRFHQHIDGANLGLCNDDGTPVSYAERTYWRAVYVPADVFERLVEVGLPDPWDRPWIESDWYLPTRQAAIDRMLRAGGES
jgi:hypothetical protein